MIFHVVIGSNDIQRSKRFYDAVLGTFGAGEGQVYADAAGNSRILYQHDGGTLVVTQPINGEPATVANGSTIGFKCGTPEQVLTFHDVAVQNGGVSIEDKPGPREGMGNMHLGYVRDPDGHKLCGIYFPG